MTEVFSSAGRFATPWHKISYDRFISDRLPALLAERLPLAGYSFQPSGAHTLELTLELAGSQRILPVTFAGIPRPDEQGLFWLDGAPLVVIPLASCEQLDRAEVRCAGEQLYDFLLTRLGTAPSGADWDDSLARAFLPLDTWFDDFLRTTAQHLDDTNWHSRTTHLRRILVADRRQVIAPGQMGRVDPFETPEGPNIGRVFTIALGAEIRGERLVIVDQHPAAALGHNAAMIPFIEHDDANRLLMGVNMMRQGLVPPSPEPALVQTGLEPENGGPDLWCGRNLLTAFVAWGEASVEDGLIISESCAQRLDYPYPAEPGDKLANRHGTKGVVAQVLPDRAMPHLADGTPVEIVFSFTGLAMRMNFGQVREALMGRIAHAEGRPAVVPPFAAPGEAELRDRLRAAGLPESGMERLRAGQDGQLMPYASTVGWVYWYRLVHLARGKIRAVGAAGQPLSVETAPPSQAALAQWIGAEEGRSGQTLGELELGILLRLGARALAREALTTRAVRFTLGENAAEQLPGETGPQGQTLSPYFRSLTRRLAAAGIHTLFEDGQLRFRFQTPPGETLRLARKLRHPWLAERSIEQVGAPPEEAGPAARLAYGDLARTNERLQRWWDSLPPDILLPGDDTQTVQRASGYGKALYQQVENNLTAYLDALLPAEALQVSERQAYSLRAVIAPAVGLGIDQVGLPEPLARALFSAAGQPDEPLEARLARNWVVVLRTPAILPTALLAFHPVLVDGPAIRLHPLACTLLNADFDGDQVAVFLPESDEAQREAGQILSVAGHLARDPGLIEMLHPPHEGVWGLAYRSLDPNGRRQIAEALELTTPAGVAAEQVAAPFGPSELTAALRGILRAQGPEAALQAAQRLARLGYEAASASGASLSPFPVSQVALPPAPADVRDTAAWEAWVEASVEAVLAGRDYANPNLGPQLLSAAVRPRSRRTLHMLVGPRGPVVNSEGQTVIVRHSLAEGRSADELLATVAPARAGLAKLVQAGEEILNHSSNPDTWHPMSVLARARRARRPGIVFARAAASGEFEPLSDADVRVLLGLE